MLVPKQAALIVGGPSSATTGKMKYYAVYIAILTTIQINGRPYKFMDRLPLVRQNVLSDPES